MDVSCFATKLFIYRVYKKNLKFQMPIKHRSVKLNSPYFICLPLYTQNNSGRDNTTFG